MALVEITLAPPTPAPMAYRADLNYAVLCDGEVRALFWTEVLAREFLRGVFGDIHPNWTIQEIAARNNPPSKDSFSTFSR